MFTGLVEGMARVRRVDPDTRGVRLEVETPLAGELRHGDSIAVNGVCLTAIEPGDGAFRADVMRETLHRSSLGPLAEGDDVNVELPLRASDRLGGHVVQGHVDATGTVFRLLGHDGYGDLTEWEQFPAGAATPMGDAIRRREAVVLTSRAERIERYPQPRARAASTERFPG